MSTSVKNIIVVSLLALWALGCKDSKPTESGSDPAPEEALARDYAMQAQRALGQTLQKKIAEAGPAGAVEFCNVRALPITDSVARSRGVRIQRVTDRPRNPLNRASDAEAELIAQWKNSLAEGKSLAAAQIRKGDTAHFYFPIRTNAMCMNCHGTPGKEIGPEVLEELRLKYPQDEAYPYRPGELRGSWKITFDLSSSNQNP